MIFKNPPPDFQKEIDVVGCYVMNDGKFLMLRRHAHKTSGNAWGLPAGKRNADETIEQAMQRELQEETGIEIPEENLRYFDYVSVRHEGHDFHYHMFSVGCDVVPEVRLSPSEHQAFRWVTAEDALLMPLVHDQDECVQIFFSADLVP